MYTRPLTFYTDGESLLLDTDEGIRPVGIGLRHLAPRVPGDVDGYIRLTSDQTMAAPYTVTGRIRTISNAGRAGVFPDGVAVWYNPALVVHPVYGSDATDGRPVDNNTLISLGHTDRLDGKVGVSAEMRTERPERPYGARSGYESRTLGRFPVPFWDGQWHDLKVTVHSSAHYVVWWDGKLMADVVENTPATVRPGMHHFGLRLDFCDVALGEFTVSEPNRQPPPPPVVVPPVVVPPPPVEEVAAMTIPGVETFHPRESWVDPAYPVVGPAVDQAAIDTAVIHYTASPRIPGDLPAFHRAMQRDYTVNRGYSLGYRWSVAQSGEVFQIRGWDLKPAANRDHNGHTEPILVLVDGDDAATPAAVASVRAIIAESQRRSGRQFAIVGHGQIGSTSCPGVGLRAQIAAGVFTPGGTPPPPPPPPMELPMKYYALPPTATGNRAHIVVIDGACRYRCNGDTDPLPEIRLPEEQYVQLRKSAGLGPG